MTLRRAANRALLFLGLVIFLGILLLYSTLWRIPEKISCGNIHLINIQKYAGGFSGMWGDRGWIYYRSPFFIKHIPSLPLSLHGAAMRPEHMAVVHTNGLEHLLNGWGSWAFGMHPQHVFLDPDRFSLEEYNDVVACFALSSRIQTAALMKEPPLGVVQTFTCRDNRVLRARGHESDVVLYDPSIEQEVTRENPPRIGTIDWYEKFVLTSDDPYVEPKVKEWFEEYMTPRLPQFQSCVNAEGLTIYEYYSGR